MIGLQGTRNAYSFRLIDLDSLTHCKEYHRHFSAFCISRSFQPLLYLTLSHFVLLDSLQLMRGPR